MNLTNISDEELHLNTVTYVESERSAVTAVLHHLRENERRRLFSKLGYKSLHDYAERELKYPGDQAYRRISAMRLLKELPELQDRLDSGSLSLTHLSEAKRVFNKKPMSRVAKLQLMSRMSNTSTREAQKILVEVAPEVVQKDSVRTVSTELKKFNFVGSHLLAEKLDELMGHFAHSGLSMGELIEKLADLGLADVRKKSSMVRKRDGHKCVKCSSTYALQVDHIKPKALGGDDSLSNLRLLCRSCNQRAAIEVYGVGHMSKFLREGSAEYEILGAAKISSCVADFREFADVPSMRGLSCGLPGCNSYFFGSDFFTL